MVRQGLKHRVVRKDRFVLSVKTGMTTCCCRVWCTNELHVAPHDNLRVILCRCRRAKFEWVILQGMPSEVVLQDLSKAINPPGIL